MKTIIRRVMQRVLTAVYYLLWFDKLKNSLFQFLLRCDGSCEKEQILLFLKPRDIYHDV